MPMGLLSHMGVFPLLELFFSKRITSEPGPCSSSDIHEVIYLNNYIGRKYCIKQSSQGLYNHIDSYKRLMNVRVRLRYLTDNNNNTKV